MDCVRPNFVFTFVIVFTMSVIILVECEEGKRRYVTFVETGRAEESAVANIFGSRENVVKVIHVCGIQAYHPDT